MRIHLINSESYVDGPGKRVVMFAQGCTLACPGCQSKHLWPSEGGKLVSNLDLARVLFSLAGKDGAITLSGGEVFQQPAALAEVCYSLRDLGFTGHLLAYSGYTWEELLRPDHPAAAHVSVILQCLDVLVDGRFEHSLDDNTITYRGSRNQRPIDVPASLQAGRVIVLNWDDEIVITPDGEIILPVGWVQEFSDLGTV